MGKVIHKSSKPLQVNPFKLSQPMGATMAFLGIDKCMPLMHGGQGCTSFTKVFLTRHFCEPIAIQTTAVTDAMSILRTMKEALRVDGREPVKRSLRKLSNQRRELTTTSWSCCLMSVCSQSR